LEIAWYQSLASRYIESPTLGGGKSLYLTGSKGQQREVRTLNEEMSRGLLGKTLPARIKKHVSLLKGDTVSLPAL